MARTYKLTGGDKLEAALTLIALKAKNSAALRVGFKEGATEPDGQPTALIAFLNEFGKIVRSKDGDYYQLPRPFFRIMISKESGDWGGKLGKLLVACDYDAVAALKLLGEEIKGELQESIQALESPPLAVSTIKQKGFSKPLIHTSTMWKNVDFWVSDDEKEFT